MSIELQKLEETEKNRQGGEHGGLRGLRGDRWRLLSSCSFSNSSNWCMKPALGEISLRQDLTNSNAVSSEA